MIYKTFLTFILETIFFLVLITQWINFNLPSLDKTKHLIRNNYIKVYDDSDNLIAQYGDKNEKHVQFDDIPDYVIQSLVYTEDKNFFKHKGFDWIALIRSFFITLMQKKTIGGSTITQQLSKNILQNQAQAKTFDRNIVRKIKEAILTYKIERKYTKKEILFFYLNRVYFGRGCFGIESASKSYFNKTTQELNLYEAALLVGILQAPSRFAGNIDLWKSKALIVLNHLKNNNKITQKDINDFSDFDFSKKTLNKSHISYFTDYVLENIPKNLRYKDLKIKTTLNQKMQSEAFYSIKHSYDTAGEDWKATQGTMIIIKKNGEIKALVGGLDYNKSQFNRVTKSIRPSGSFAKFFVYLKAMELGLNPESFVDDSQIKIGSWEPSNYLDVPLGKKTILMAFAQSTNSIAIRLLQACGIKNVVKLVRKMDIQTEITPTLSFTLGGFNATLLDLTKSFIPVLNKGKFIKPYVITEIRDLKTNKILYKKELKYKKIFDKRTAYNMWRVLRATMTPMGSGRRINTNNKILGGKSGTSNNYKDSYFLISSTEYIIGCWFGRDDYKPMINQPGRNLNVLAFKKLFETFPISEKDIDFDLDLGDENNKTIEDLIIET